MALQRPLEIARRSLGCPIHLCGRSCDNGTASCPPAVCYTHPVGAFSTSKPIKFEEAGSAGVHNTLLAKV
eukprot:scaffold640_cov362-Pavlova_lutheri.AAC.7